MNIQKNKKIQNETKINIIILKKDDYISDDKIDKKEGHYIPESYYNKIVNSDSDVYYLDENNKKKLLLKFRKNVISQKDCINAFNSFYKVAQKKNRNRGAAAGLINTMKLPNYVGKINHQDKFRVFYYDKKGKLKKDNIGNPSMSNIIGYYDRPDRNNYSKNLIKNNTVKNKNTKNTKKQIKSIPMCRTTAFTKQNVDKWKKCLPLLIQADKQFKKLIPSRHNNQLKRAQQTPKFQIKNTAFSTITLNYNWRTACHKDSGDLEEGFGNLLVLEKDKCKLSNHSFQGGYLGFPKFKICVDVRQGDFLAMDVHQWHCNTPIKKLQNQIIIDNNSNNDKNKKSKNNHNNKNDYGRLSVVCYLRKDMIKCKNKNYN